MIKFIIFDLGRVLVRVDVDRFYHQFSEEFNIDTQELKQQENGAHEDFMLGTITGEQFHEITLLEILFEKLSRKD